MEMTLGSLFDGAGGFPLAGAIAGITPIWASEIEPFPIRVTTRRLPQMKHLGNITEMDGRSADPVDVITFGSPCQDLSVAGRREGLTGERSGLFREAIRIIREMREETHGQQPKYIVWENVPGAFSSNKGEDFRTVLEEIAKIKDTGASIPRPEKGKWMPAGEIVGDDYSIAWRTYDAQYWGVPQRRKRIYLVADFTGRRAGHIQFERESLCGNLAQGSGEGQGAAGSPAGDAGTPGEGVDLYNGRLTGEIATSITASMGASAARMEPSVICLMDMGGSKMDITEGIAGTLRANAKGHDPVIADTWAIQGSMIGREKKNGPQGSGINENVCFTLNTKDRHAVVTPLAFHLTQDPITSERIAPCIGTGNSRNGQASIGAVVPKATVYGLSAKDSNAWKSSNPHSGCYEAEATRTLDTHGGNPTCAQGGNIIVQEARVYENHGQDSRCRELGDIGETVAAKYGTGGNNTPIVVEGKPYSIGNGQVHDLGLDEKAKTLSCMHDQQAVITPQDGYPYRARRLTPLECSRLQGYPDWWRIGLDTAEPAEEEIDEWAAIFETHRKITAPSIKPKTRNQVRKWLKHPQSDSAEYRMWGNSLAIPCAYTVLAGIAEALTESERSKGNESRATEETRKQGAGADGLDFDLSGTVGAGRGECAGTDALQRIPERTQPHLRDDGEGDQKRCPQDEAQGHDQAVMAEDEPGSAERGIWGGLERRSVHPAPRVHADRSRMEERDCAGSQEVGGQRVGQGSQKSPTPGTRAGGSVGGGDMDEITMMPTRRCKRCGRLLFSKEALEKGYGCQCAKHVRQEELARQPIDGQQSLMDFLTTESEE